MKKEVKPEVLKSLAKFPLFCCQILKARINSIQISIPDILTFKGRSSRDVITEFVKWTHFTNMNYYVSLTYSLFSLMERRKGASIYTAMPGSYSQTVYPGYHFFPN